MGRTLRSSCNRYNDVDLFSLDLFQGRDSSHRMGTSSRKERYRTVGTALRVAPGDEHVPE